MTMETDERLAAAYHEAGHAVVALSYGLFTSGAKILLGTARCEAAGLDDADGCFLPGRMPCRPQQACPIFHAGHVAQEKYIGRPIDRERWRSDRAEIKRNLLFYDFGDDDWEAESERWLPKTSKIVDFYWPAIQAVAEELAEQDELNSAQVLEIAAPHMDR